MQRRGGNGLVHVLGIDQGIRKRWVRWVWKRQVAERHRGVTAGQEGVAWSEMTGGLVKWQRQRENE